MTLLQPIERNITPEELDLVHQGFDQHTEDNNVSVQSSDRYGYVIESDNQLIGCSSGLAYKNGASYSGWFYLTDLIVFNPHRGYGYGKMLLSALENKIASLGICRIWTWTAGYEAPDFYKKIGYTEFMSMDNWYSDGSPRIGLIKTIVPLSAEP